MVERPRVVDVSLYLGERADRPLQMRLLPLAYNGSSRRSLAVHVSGTLHDRLTLEPGWGAIRAEASRTGVSARLERVTLKYGYAVSPARVMPGNGDTRTPAVAFDYVALTRVR